GLYRISEGTIYWDKASAPGLAVIYPGQTISLGFNFSSLPNTELLGIKDPFSTLKVSATASRFDSRKSVSEPITVNLSRTIKFQSSAGFSSRVVYGVGPFKNTGPIPPQVDTKTTYTVVWSLVNYTSTITHTTV